jgi:hypothetical protein
MVEEIYIRTSFFENNSLWGGETTLTYHVIPAKAGIQERTLG